MSNLDERKQQSTNTEVATVYTPGTGDGKECTITNIINAPDTFSYGNIQDENGNNVNVYYSPFRHGWYRG
jgi:hypothetical protein